MVSLHIAHVAAQLVILGLAARLHIIDSYPRLQAARRAAEKGRSWRRKNNPRRIKNPCGK